MQYSSILKYYTVDIVLPVLPIFQHRSVSESQVYLYSVYSVLSAFQIFQDRSVSEIESSFSEHFLPGSPHEAGFMYPALLDPGSFLPVPHPGCSEQIA